MKLIAVPLILVSLIIGVSDLKNLSSLSKMGFRTVSIFLLTTITAVFLGLLLVNFIKPGSSISEETRIRLLASCDSETAANLEKADDLLDTGPLQGVVEIIPENFENTEIAARNCAASFL